MDYTMSAPTAAGARMAMLAALVDGDIGVAYDLATGLLDEGVPFETLLTDVVVPVQAEVGQRWADGDLSVADEHAATTAAESLLAILAGGLGAPDGPAVIVACPEHDTHALPARLIAAALTMRGYRAVCLGGSIPAAEIGDYLAHVQPVAFLLSISMASAVFHACEATATAHAHGVPVIAGGRVLDREPERARRLGADAFAANPAELAEVLETWQVTPPQRLAASVAPHPECAALERLAPGLIGTALASGFTTEPAVGRRLTEELDRVLRVLQGALTIDDPRLVSDHAHALRSADRAHGLSASVIDPVVAQLGRAMQDNFPEARQMLTHWERTERLRSRSEGAPLTALPAGPTPSPGRSAKRQLPPTPTSSPTGVASGV